MAAAPLHGAVGELGILAGHDEVAGRGDHQAAHDAVALDLGDGGLGNIAPAHGVLEEALRQAPVLVAESLDRMFLLVFHFLRAAEVVAGREVLAGAGQDDDAHRLVLRGGDEGVVELFQ